MFDEETGPMAATVSPALRALLERVIDYAGMFPPAMLAADEAITNYEGYRHGHHSWMLRFLVVAADQLGRVPSPLSGSLAVLSDTDQPRAAVIESKAIVAAKRPVYCEVAAEAAPSLLAETRDSGCFAKLRTGGVMPD